MRKIRLIVALGTLAVAVPALTPSAADAGVGSWLKSKAKSAASAVKKTVSSVGSKISSAASSAKNWVKGAAGSVANWWSCVGKSTSGGTLRKPSNAASAFTKYFSHSSKANNWSNAWLAALVAKLTYLTRYSGAQDLMKSFGFSQVQFIRKSCRNAIVAANDDMVLIAFEGASLSSPTDLTKVMKTASKRALGGKVHSGFYEVGNEFWSSVKGFVTRHGRKGRSYKRIWLVGHSLGGAVATLTAARLKASKIPVQGIYTFGQPGVGDRSFVRRFSGSVYRFVASGDCAPGYPRGFSTPGKILFFDTKGKSSSKSALPKENKSPGCWTTHSSAHDISTYMGRIQKQLSSGDKDKLPSTY